MPFALALIACLLGELRVESTAQLRAALRAAEPGDEGREAHAWPLVGLDHVEVAANWS